MNINNLKGFFVCNQCRSTCKDGCDDVGPYGPNSCVKAYFPRKQFVKCLGPYCDSPCKLKQKKIGFDNRTVNKLSEIFNSRIEQTYNKNMTELEYKSLIDKITNSNDATPLTNEERCLLAYCIAEGFFKVVYEEEVWDRER